jgi:hypothetical protein
MTLSRALKRLVCLGLIGQMLCSQLAVAAFVCPRVGCDQMAGQLDKNFPELCAMHCDYGRQIDQVQAPAVPPIVLISLYVVAPTIHEAVPSMSAIAASVDTPAVASPPHAILHCCLRI